MSGDGVRRQRRRSDSLLTLAVDHLVAALVAQNLVWTRNGDSRLVDLVKLSLVAVPLFLRTNHVVVGEEELRGRLAAQAVLGETLGFDSTAINSGELTFFRTSSSGSRSCSTGLLSWPSR